MENVKHHYVFNFAKTLVFHKHNNSQDSTGFWVIYHEQYLNKGVIQVIQKLFKRQQK